jgi:hypothetical protein
MSKTIHVSLSVRGALKWPASRRRRLFRYRNGAGGWMRARDATDVLLGYLADGVELLPLGDCEGHDPKTGCPGHQSPEAA